MGPMDPVFLLLLVLLLLAVWFALAFNRLVALQARVENGWAQIDVQLRRRADLIPNLVETVQGYATHEREVFEAITAARAQSLGATTVGEQSAAERSVGLGLRSLLAVAEAYPTLKADANFLALQEELSGTESKIAYARQFYNDEVMRLNTAIGSFPSNLIARTFGFSEREFFDPGDAAREPVRVDFPGGA
jgi:LemA protein